MKQTNSVRQGILSLTAMLTVLCPRITYAQSPHPVAVQPMELSAFGGVSGVYTGLEGGKNLGLTAGADLALPPVYHIRPGLEFRGTYPVDKGTIASQRSVLGGARVDFPLRHSFRSYGDVLFGRGQMNYGNGFFYKNFEYVLTTTWVYSLGGGVDLPISDHLRLKLDAQAQRWSNTPVDSGTIWAKAGTVGLVYIVNFNRHGIH